MSEPVPVLTLWQPWASLVALGVKTIETRSWSTDYRGRLAIHASGSYRPLVDSVVGAWRIGIDPDYQGWPIMFGPNWEDMASLPLGAIIAIATLVDVLPIIRWSDGIKNHGVPCVAAGPSPLDVSKGHDDARLVRFWNDDRDPGRYREDIADQLPYSDFTPGRFAWLLTDVEVLPEPVPFKGGQQLGKEVGATRIGFSDEQTPEAFDPGPARP